MEVQMPPKFIPRDCSSCGQRLVPAKGGNGLCQRCYDAARYRSQRSLVLARSRAWAATHVEERRRIGREWWRSHAVRERQKRREWPEDRKAKERVRKRKRYQARREQEAETRIGWRLSHPELMRLYRSRWKRRNPAAVNENTQRRRVRLKGRPAERISLRQKYTVDRGLGGICGKRVPFAVASLDHIQPVSLGGAHVRANV